MFVSHAVKNSLQEQATNNTVLDTPLVRPSYNVIRYNYGVSWGPN